MLEKEKVLAIIPARGGSKGLPGKNIKELAGKPLIAYTIEAAKKSKYIDRLIVSTDDLNIAKVSEKFGAEVPFIRPKVLSTDYASSVDVACHAIYYLEQEAGYRPQYVVLLQCTTPFINDKDIDASIHKCLEQKVEAVVSICESEVNPFWTLKFEGKLLQDVIPGGNDIDTRQLLPQTYRLNGGIYVVRTDVFLKERTFMPYLTTGYVMPSNRSIDIDTQEDFDLCEYFIKKDKGDV